MNAQLIKFLINNEYKEYPSIRNSRGENEAKLFCKPVITKFECFCNERPVQLCVNYCNFILHGGNVVEMLDIGITACSNDDLWYQLKCYGIKAQELMDNINQIENKVIKAWEAVNEKTN